MISSNGQICKDILVHSQWSELKIPQLGGEYSIRIEGYQVIWSIRLLNTTKLMSSIKRHWLVQLEMLFNNITIKVVFICLREMFF